MAVFALVDCNNFYASCEKLFNPKLRDIPVVVLSNNDGCVVARSAEAKVLGVPMGAPWFKLKDEGKRPATPSPPGSPNSVFVSTPNDVDTNTLQFLLNSASAYACPAVGQ